MWKQMILTGDLIWQVLWGWILTVDSLPIRGPDLGDASTTGNTFRPALDLYDEVVYRDIEA